MSSACHMHMMTLASMNSALIHWLDGGVALQVLRLEVSAYRSEYQIGSQPCGARAALVWNVHSGLLNIRGRPRWVLLGLARTRRCARTVSGFLTQANGLPNRGTDAAMRTR